MTDGLPVSLEELEDYTRDAPPSARFGFELAALDLRAAAEGRALPELLHPNPSRTVRLSPLLSGLEEVGRVRDRGYAAAKLKVGRGSVGEDVELARVVSVALGDAQLRLDANRAWSFEEAEEFAGWIPSLPVEYVEEPLAEPAGLAELVRRTGLPVALDETLATMEPEELTNYSHVSAVVFKPTMLGLSRSLRFAEEVRRLGVPAAASSAYESGVGTLGLVALASALGDEALAGLDTYRALAADVLEPGLELSGPRLDVMRTLSRVREVRRDLLEKWYEFG